MPDAPPPPPPPQTYQPAPSPASGSVVRLPAGMTLWDLLGFLIILVGGILILAGFLLGDAAIAAQTSSPPNPGNFQSDYEGFFLWTGIGAFLVVLGWLFRMMLGPILTARKGAAPSGTPAPATMQAAPAVAPPAPAPVAPAPVPATPLCPKCGQPTAYIAQYGRYYCYTDAVYV